VLVAKLLQNLANGVPFAAKEAYMLPLNAFLQRHHATLRTFIDQFVVSLCLPVLQNSMLLGCIHV
jgi:hypothetical protein